MLQILQDCGKTSPKAINLACVLGRILNQPFMIKGEIAKPLPGDSKFLEKEWLAQNYFEIPTSTGSPFPNWCVEILWRNSLLRKVHSALTQGAIISFYFVYSCMDLGQLDSWMALKTSAEGPKWLQTLIKNPAFIIDGASAWVLLPFLKQLMGFASRGLKQ